MTLVHMSGDDWLAEQDAEAAQTLALAAGVLGMTEREVREVAATWPAGYPYRLYFIEQGTDSGIREASLNPRRIYFNTENGKVTGYSL
jgi:hypothetical protein